MIPKIKSNNFKEVNCSKSKYIRNEENFVERNQVEQSSIFNSISKVKSNFHLYIKMVENFQDNRDTCKNMAITIFY